MASFEKFQIQTRNLIYSFVFYNKKDFKCQK